MSVANANCGFKDYVPFGGQPWPVVSVSCQKPADQCSSYNTTIVPGQGATRYDIAYTDEENFRTLTNCLDKAGVLGWFAHVRAPSSSGNVTSAGARAGSNLLYCLYALLLLTPTVLGRAVPQLEGRDSLRFTYGAVNTSLPGDTERYNPSCNPAQVTKCFGLESLNKDLCYRVYDQILAVGYLGDAQPGQNNYYEATENGERCAFVWSRVTGSEALARMPSLYRMFSEECDFGAVSFCQASDSSIVWLENGQDHTSIPARRQRRSVLQERESNSFQINKQTTYKELSPELVSSQIPNGSQRSFSFDQTVTRSETTSVSAGLGSIFVATVSYSVATSEASSQGSSTTLTIDCPSGSDAFVYFSPYYVVTEGDFLPEGPFGYERAEPMVINGGEPLGRFFFQCEQ